MPDINLSEVLCKYPCLGRIKNIATEHKYGYVGPEKLLIHIRNHADKRLKSLEGLEGQYVAYVLGGNPIRYAEGKKWESQIVEWQLLQSYEYLASASASKLESQRISSEIERRRKISLTTYESERSRILSTLEEYQLCELLTATWYKNLWKQKTGELPKSILHADDILKDVVSKRPATFHNLCTILSFVDLISNSPWFSEDEKEIIRKKHPRIESYPLSVFSIAREQINQAELEKLTNLCGDQLKRNIRMANAVAIDLESNGKEIFQFGWKTSKGNTKTEKIQGTNEPINIKSDFRRCLEGTQAPIIIGHNLLAWDKKILEEHGVKFPEQSACWDTLITSWILEPWKKSHALIVLNNAHSADADAAECYKLFEEQTLKLDHLLEIFEHDLAKLVDKLFEDSALLSTLPTREYPSTLSTRHHDSDTYLACNTFEAAWQKDCCIELSNARKFDDPILSPEICRNVAVGLSDASQLSAKIVSIVVSDAYRQGIQILLSYLPFWLVDKELRSTLQREHFDYNPEHKARLTIRFAEDWFRHDNTEQLLAFYHPCWTNKTELCISWQQAKAETILNREGLAYPGLYTSETEAGWILGEYSEKQPCKRLPLSFPTCLTPNKHSSLDAVTSSWVCVPRWHDPVSVDIDYGKAILSPDAYNRRRYREDSLQKLLNLQQAIQKDEILLFCMRWPDEVRELQKIIEDLSLSSPRNECTSLRHLEAVIKDKHSVLVCSWNTLADYLQAAEIFQKKVRIAIEELPLLNWHAAIKPPSQTSTSNTEHEDDMDADEGGLSENVRLALNEGRKETPRRVVLTYADRRDAVATFLLGWLRRRTRTDEPPSKPILLLDSRITDNSTARSLQLDRINVPYNELNEVLSQEQTEMLRKHFFSARVIPNDYEEYKAYLKKGWGFDDFRSGPQKQAIQKFIETKNDLLVRLPTGGGKSIIFHLPALLRTQYSHRLVVVITPLRALMDDQVKGLWARGFSESVDFLSGGRDPWLNDDVYQGIRDGRIRLLFVAPERFRMQKFIDTLEKRRLDDDGLEFIVFDEAHCISEWGFEFRPDYLYAARYVAEQFKNSNLPGNPTRLLLTSATITQRNRLDLEKELGLSRGNYEDLPNDMPHPIQPYIELKSFGLQEEEDIEGDQKLGKIIEIISGLELDKSALLLFVRKRSDCHQLSDKLNEYADQKGSKLQKLSALPFHAGLHENEKEEAVTRLKYGKTNVLVCTKAFGMGMDIGHIHACIHYQPPTFIEDYLQEVGRIGRDEEKRLETGNEVVTATLLYNTQDQERNLGLLHDMAINPPMLQDFLAYCQTGATQLSGKLLNFIPARVRLSDTKELTQNQVINCLFWLERMKVLQVAGKVPPFLELRLHRTMLAKIAEGRETLTEELANALLEIEGKSNDAISQLSTVKTESSTPSSESALGRVVKGLLRGVFALFTPPKPTEKTTTDVPQAHIENISNTDNTSEVIARFSMSKLMSSCGGVTQDQLFEGLVDLSIKGAVEIQKTIKVKTRSIPSSEERFWDLCKDVIKIILTKPAKEKEKRLDKKQLEADLLKKYQQSLGARRTFIKAFSQNRVCQT